MPLLSVITHKAMLMPIYFVVIFQSVIKKIATCVGGNLERERAKRQSFTSGLWHDKQYQDGIAPSHSNPPSYSSPRTRPASNNHQDLSCHAYVAKYPFLNPPKNKSARYE
jgi:hypothetical protein